MNASVAPEVVRLQALEAPLFTGDANSRERKSCKHSC